jgi:methionyl-tRNA formyltransferase
MSIFENEMIISCKDATSVQIEIIQMEGKNKVSGQEFITAYEDLIKSHKKIEFTTR